MAPQNDFNSLPTSSTSTVHIIAYSLAAVIDIDTLYMPCDMAVISYTSSKTYISTSSAALTSVESSPAFI